MTLKEARVLFTGFLAKLIIYAEEKSYYVAFAEGMDRITPRDSTTDHMKGSLHEFGLAQDVDLYLGDSLSEAVWQTTTEAHLDLGQYWESLHPYCRWGGRFGDGNHYSFAPPELVGNRA